MMKVSIMLVTTDYRGDHSADVRIAYELQADESVDHLVKRLLSSGSASRKVDYIELRIIEEASHD